MDAVNEVFSFKFILGVFVTLIIVQIFRYYCQPVFDSLLGSISSQWKTYSARIKKEHEELLDKYEQDHLLVLLLINRNLGGVMLMVLCMIASLMFLVIGSSPLLLEGELFSSPQRLKELSSIFLGLATLLFLLSSMKMTILRDLRRRRIAALQIKT